ncbi:unnamed protein product [Effrenium voratum]|uniref:AMP-dependent synthetase/ligase domain-containing protein n=1 Tax=Effrenium voratum TaxID=2562239 RepID=A0AA36J2X4_9DINO|nr:unnamed protein product [Effrenium voratum]
MGFKAGTVMRRRRLCCLLQPDNLIITKTANGYHTQTFSEHFRRSKCLASALTKRGVQLEDRIATLMWNSCWHMECYHAIPCMGAVLHTLNLRLGPSDLGYIIEHAKDRATCLFGVRGKMGVALQAHKWV